MSDQTGSIFTKTLNMHMDNVLDFKFGKVRFLIRILNAMLWAMLRGSITSGNTSVFASY
jgi:hypothetical protein